MATPSPSVLVLNSGSSSLKASLRDGAGGRLWQEQRAWDGGDGSRAMESLLEDWLAPVIAAADPAPTLVAHRIVHGGASFTRPTRLSPAVLRELEALVPLAPLHNGPALQAIAWLQQWLAAHPLADEAAIPQWACFDTGFHASLSPAAFTYALPAAWRDQGLRRFGFHGLNHQHVAETVARLHPGARRVISCHLGAGCSLAAIAIAADGTARSIDTTMGFTPLEGLVMASRSGSVDPGLLLQLLRQGISAEELDHGLNHASGLRGLSELSGDMRELRTAADQGHAGALLAIAVFRHRLLQGIGAMAASLGGVTVIALTGGIGEHDDALLEELRERLDWLQPLVLLRVAADEEGLMARQCLAAMAS
ncbi:acetate kinase [Cyanobium sp. ATX 6A2]|uniref:acetate/propionate family kinase n=1 Tax=Cyanobium sp. ATX 6A2 TaxID=2823700 RepID=UPI0020CDD9E1|nr:acetate kinase [Cyanobium sp. ATX 6A2]MCP9888489.1 acetate kinase [Cyanobium sp. ATX 6A2]